MGTKLVSKVIKLTVDAAGTRKRFTAESTTAVSFEVWLDSTNTGNVFLGGSDVDSTHTPRGIGDTVNFVASTRGDFAQGDYYDLRDFYADAATSGDKMVITYEAPG